MSDEQKIISKTEKPNSFEFGKAGSRFKIYFDEPDELLLLLPKCFEAESLAKKLSEVDVV